MDKFAGTIINTMHMQQYAVINTIYTQQYNKSALAQQHDYYTDLLPTFLAVLWQLHRYN